MWTRKPAKPELVEAVRDIVFHNSHKNCNENFIIRSMPESDLYEVINAIAEARDQGFIYCTNGRWAPRAEYVNNRKGKPSHGNR